MQSQFHIAQGENSVGPFTVSQIVEQLLSNQLTTEDLVYIDEKQDWLKISGFNPIVKRYEILKKSQASFIAKAKENAKLQKEALAQAHALKEESKERIESVKEEQDTQLETKELKVEMNEKVEVTTAEEADLSDRFIKINLFYPEISANKNMINKKSQDVSKKIQQTKAVKVQKQEVAHEDKSISALSSNNEGMMLASGQMIRLENGQLELMLSHKISEKIEFKLMSSNDSLDLSENKKEILVHAGRAESLSIEGSSELIAGEECNFVVSAKDSFGNIDNNFTQTLSVKVTGQAECEKAVEMKNGKGSLCIKNNKAESMSFEIFDGSNISLKATHKLKVKPAKAAKLIIDTPAEATAGEMIRVALKAVDSFGNLVTDFNGAVELAALSQSGKSISLNTNKSA